MDNQVIHGDAYDSLLRLPDGLVNCCVTSPPYWGLRDYGVDGQLGLEKTPGDYVRKLVKIFREVRRVLRDDGTLWLNIGDSYCGGGRGSYMDDGSKQATNIGSLGMIMKDNCFKRIKGIKQKELVGIPWMVAFALRADGWYLRQDIIWHKPNPMPESVTDRCTKSHEYIFLFSKQAQYYYDNEAIAEPISESYANDNRPHGVIRQRFYHNSKYVKSGMVNIHKNLQEKGQQPNTMHLKRLNGNGDEQYPVRNKRSVWTVNTEPCPEAHFAVYPTKLITPCILAGCPAGGIVLDPFFGSGTTGLVAKKHGRKYIGIELNNDYTPIQNRRLAQEELFACR